MSERVYSFLKIRITVVTNLPLAGIDKMALGTRLREIGRLPGATVPRPQVG